MDPTLEDGAPMTVEAASITLTVLEFEVITRVRDGVDPWSGHQRGVGSRVTSQALSRLQKKGLIQTDPLKLGYVLTDKGRWWLEEPR